jgi:hypothetical protein
MTSQEPVMFRTELISLSPFHPLMSQELPGMLPALSLTYREPP